MMEHASYGRKDLKLVLHCEKLQSLRVGLTARARRPMAVVPPNPLY